MSHTKASKKTKNRKDSKLSNDAEDMDGIFDGEGDGSTICLIKYQSTFKL